MKKDVIVIGAGGHGKVVADIVLSSADNLLGFLDDFACGEVMGYEVLGRTDDYTKYPNAYFVIAMGSNEMRRSVSERLKGVNWYTAIHPSAVVSQNDVTIGNGTVVMACAVINPGASIGEFDIINTGCVIEHDNRIGDFTHISPNATLCGTVSVGDMCHIGASAVVKNNISICSNVTVGAAAAVVKDITSEGTYIGVPAVRRLK